MKKIYLRFYASLNQFFPAEKDGKIHTHYFKGRQSIKDRIESMGVPHTEIHLLLVNGSPVDFDYLVQEEDRISVYPPLSFLKLPDNFRLRPPYPGKPRFILDCHLGKLARYLRRFNFDTAYQNDYQDEEIVEKALAENRIIVTRDHGLLMRRRITYGFFIHNDDPKRQLQEIFHRYDLLRYYDNEEEQAARCPECNTPLEAVDKQEIIHRLEPKTKKYFQEFQRCPNCDKIFWRGSHYKRTETFLESIRDPELPDEENKSQVGGI